MTKPDFMHEDYLGARATPKMVAQLSKKSAKSVRKSLEAGRAAHLKDDWRLALKHYNVAWTHDPDNLDVLTLIAYCLVQLDAREQVMDVVERALNIHGATETLCQILGVLAGKMHFYELAEKFWREAIKFNAKSSSNFTNLLGAMYEQERFDEVVALCQEIIPIFPTDANLWSILATSIRFTDHKAKAAEFFEEALRIDPDNLRALNNYALMLGVSARGLEVNEHAVKLHPDNPELNVGLAMNYLVRGRLKEAWPHYAARLNPNRSKGQNTVYHIPFPRWDGKADADKTVVVLSEQGIGDEILFLRELHRLKADVKRVIVACDYRLVSIVERSFDVRAFRHVSIDRMGMINRSYPEMLAYIQSEGFENVHHTHMADLLVHYVDEADDMTVHKSGYLTADPERAAHFRDKLAPYAGRPLIGVTWQSLNLAAARQAGYQKTDDILALYKDFDVTLVDLQYGDVDKDVTVLKEALGDRFISFRDEVDIKLDIEANLAIMENLDFVIGPGVSTQTFGAALGRETRIIGSGRPWWNLSLRRAPGTAVPHSPNLRFYDRDPGQVTWENARQYLKDEFAAVAANKAGS